MSRFITLLAAASFAAVAAQAAPLDELHEHPEDQRGTIMYALTEVEAGTVLDAHELEERALGIHDLVAVTSFPSEVVRFV